MANGKLPNKDLQQLLKSISHNREETLVGARIGVDSAVLDFGEDLVVLSTDPVTGASKGIGSLAVDISVNDVATTGADIVACLISILAPPDATMEDLTEIMNDASKRAEALDLEIVGGHTEITDAVTRFVVQTTVIGRLNRDNFLDPSKVEPKDNVYVTKKIGMEGSFILAQDRKEKVKELVGDEGLEEFLSYGKELSVKEDGRLAAPYADYMHDITEGGFLGAVYEASRAIDQGILIDRSRLPVGEKTLELCEKIGIDPLRFISSGSMLIISGDDAVEEAFQKSEIPLTKVGIVGGDIPLIDCGDSTELIDAPEKDHLYEALRKTGDDE